MLWRRWRFRLLYYGLCAALGVCGVMGLVQGRSVWVNNLGHPVTALLVAVVAVFLTVIGPMMERHEFSRRGRKKRSSKESPWEPPAYW